MRTAEEIREWLENNGVYEAYKKNVLSIQEKSKQGQFISCSAGVCTISGAFSWCESIEGEGYWEEINDMFIPWYYQNKSENKNAHGRKNDIKDDKLRWDLLPLQDIEEIVKVFHAGAKKYGDNNWQNLDNGYERYKAALFRHLLEVEKGNEKDNDTGCYHIAQVATNAIFMLHIKLNEYRQKNEKD